MSENRNTSWEQKLGFGKGGIKWLWIIPGIFVFIIGCSALIGLASSDSEDPDSNLVNPESRDPRPAPTYPTNPLATQAAAEPTLTPTPAPTATRRPTATPSTSPQEAMDLAVLTMLQYAEVLDAAIFQVEYGFNLVLLVQWNVNAYQAQQIGEAFLRSFKTFNDDDNPGTTVGRGKYDYNVGVYYPDETLLAIGSKASVAYRISW